MAVTEEVFLKRLNESLKNLGVTDPADQASFSKILRKLPQGAVAQLFSMEDEKEFLRQEAEFRSHIKRLRPYFKGLKFLNPVKAAIMFINRLGQPAQDPLTSQLFVVLAGYQPATTNIDHWVTTYVSRQLVEVLEDDSDLDPRVLQKLARSLTKLPIQCCYFGNLPKMVGELACHPLVIRLGAWLAGGPELDTIDQLALTGHLAGVESTAWSSPAELLAAVRGTVESGQKLAQTIKDQEAAIAFVVYQALANVADELCLRRESQAASS